MAASDGCVRIGLSGWSYADWKGTFYPAGLKPRDWLGFYAERYPCVEVNSTFYRLPTTTSVRWWTEATGPEFEFVFKVWRSVSHDHRLRDVEVPLAAFLERIEPARHKAGPLLVQLPPELRMDTGLLARFLDCYGRMASGWGLAVEFRHRSWYTDEVMALLDAHGAGCAVHDMAGSGCLQPNAGAPFVYVRYHGAGKVYGGSYAEADLRRDAQVMDVWRQEGRDVYAFFNNGMDGFARANADMLRGMVKHLTKPVTD